MYRGRPSRGPIVAVSGINHTDNADFALTLRECVNFIDFGCELFVMGDDGRRVRVHAVKGALAVYAYRNESRRVRCQ